MTHPGPLADVQRFAKHLTTESTALFTFLYDPQAIYATNWRGEHAEGRATRPPRSPRTTTARSVPIGLDRHVVPSGDADTPGGTPVCGASSHAMRGSSTCVAALRDAPPARVCWFDPSAAHASPLAACDLD